MRPASVVLFVVIFLLIFASSVPHTVDHIPSSFAYTTTEPTYSPSLASIEIGNNSAFVLYGFTGNGTEDNPYILEDQDISSGSYVHDTSVWFVIRDCRIVGDLSLDKVSNGAIEHCSIASNVSIYISYTQRVTVTESRFNSSVDFPSLDFWECERSTISQNEFSLCDIGLRLRWCNSTTVSDNRFLNCGIAMILDSSPYATITGNELIGCGLNLKFEDLGPSYPYSLQELLNLPYNITNNLVNGREIGFFHNQLNLDVNSAQYGQLILLNCINTSITNGNFRSCTTGIEIKYCVNCTVENSIASDCSQGGVVIQASANIALQACDITNCSSWRGIDIDHSTNTTLRACHIASCEGGVYLMSAPFLTVADCTIENNSGYGLGLVQNSNYATVIDSIFRGNLGIGLYLSDNATSVGNIVTRNVYGIDIFGSYCLVCNNTVTYNNNTGILVEIFPPGFGKHNRIYNNSIGWNGLNAFDFGFNNSWDDGSSIGNSWSDYSGIGVYRIDPNGIDHYPRILPNGSLTPFESDIILTFGLVGIVVVVAIVWLRKKRSGAQGGA